MSEYTQDNRLIRIDTALGADALLLQSFRGAEAVSELFEFDLELHSVNHDLPLDALIGQKAVVGVRLPDDSVRRIHGIVSAFSHVGTMDASQGREAVTLSRYQATLSPWLWTLRLNRDCRIFQNLSVPDIIAKIFGEHRLAESEFRLHANYQAREYCVQYRESDFDFVSRLMEEEGIFYFFEHSADAHRMILVDHESQFKESAFQPRVDFAAQFDLDEHEAVVSDWQTRRVMRSEAYELRDFNFRNPALNLTANVQSKSKREREIYDYPGEYETRDSGEKIVRVRHEEQQSQQFRISAVTNGRGFLPGFRFELHEHYRRDFNRAYAVLRVEHEASQVGNYRSGSPATDFLYRSRLTCLPHPTKFRPPRRTPVPVVNGTQTAIVVGPPGEEIFVDKHGRVKVQFHWDREGKRNDKSSCWIRVSQPWAGAGFGGMTIPRIGQEVIVDFLEGNPDNPIITGRVYNGSARPPYELPANKAHSGLMSRSTPGGGSANFNGMRMDDNTGAEGLEIQAEKDERILVKNDKSETVGNNETIEIGVDRTENVGSNQTVTVGSNDKLSVGSNRNTDIGDNDVLSVGSTRTHTVGINEAISVGAAQEISIGAVQIVSVGMTQLVNVGLKQKTTAGKEVSISAPKIILTATQELTLKCGAGIITFDATGNITIKAPLVKINT